MPDLWARDVITWESLVRGQEFDIDEPLWSDLNATLTQDQIIDLLQEAVEKSGMPYPMRHTTIEQATTDFLRLRSLDTRLLLKREPWETDFPYSYHKQDLYIDRSNVGARSSDYFHQANRNATDLSSSPSALRSWATPSLRRGLFKALFSFGVTKITPSEIRTAGSIRKYVAAQFRPSAAKAVYDLYGGGRVLDLSAGWGDRLSAALACDKVTHYTGIDPNFRLHGGYAAQVEAYNRNLDGDLFDWFSTFTPKTCNLICSPAEDLTQLDGPFDIAFTSPPYFDKERYTKDQTQSWIRYKRLDAWLQDFLFKTLALAWDNLKVGGHLCVNIADVRADEREEGGFIRLINSICDPMNDFITTLPNAVYQGAVGLRLPVRPSDRQAIGSDALFSSFCEPIWVWKKSEP